MYWMQLFARTMLAGELFTENGEFVVSRRGFFSVRRGV